jgi:hypothetical protein
VTPFASFPLNGEGEYRVFMNMAVSSNVNVGQCDALEDRLQSTDAAREPGRLVRAVMAGVGG